MESAGIRLIQRTMTSEPQTCPFPHRLKKEIEKVHKTWEKKFAILQKRYVNLNLKSYVFVFLWNNILTMNTLVNELSILLTVEPSFQGSQL